MKFILLDVEDNAWVTNTRNLETIRSMKTSRKWAFFKKYNKPRSSLTQYRVNEKKKKREKFYSGFR